MMIIPRRVGGNGTILMTIHHPAGGGAMIQIIRRRDSGMILITHRTAKDTILTPLRRAKDNDMIPMTIHRQDGVQDTILTTFRRRENPKIKLPAIRTHHRRASGMPVPVAIQTLYRHVERPQTIQIQMPHHLAGGVATMILMPRHQGGETRGVK